MTTHDGWLTPRSVTWGSVAVNSALAIGKIAAGLTCASQTILADGLHSASDLLTDAAVLAGLRVSQKPADRSHPYGHRRFSTLVAMFVGATLLGAGAWIAYSAVVALHDSPPMVRADLPFAVAVAAIPIKELLYQLTRRVARREGDLSLLANAWHHRSDAFTSIAAAIGLGGVLLGGPGWRMLDSLTALVLSAFLVVIAARVIVSSAEELIDRAPGERTLSRIRDAMGRTRGVVSFHAIRARKVGGKVEMDVHVQVDPQLTVREGHDIATAVKRAVMEADANIVEAIVHVEPTDRPGEAPQSS